MRLTCPNCGAQYEVPDGVIPTEGRDVQCSNCGNTWFQPHPDHPAPAEPEPEPVPEPELPPEPEPEPEPAAETPAEPAPEPEEAEDDAFGPAPAQGRQELDDSVSSILREEAERESQLRAEEAGGLETQPDLGLDNLPGDEAAKRAKQARDRMARMKGEPPEPEPTDPGSRRSLLPDIDEINSTLRSKNDPPKKETGALAEPVVPQQRSGFSRGFAVALLIVAVLILIYANAPRIAEAVPQANPVLNAYVALVDQARLWLDGLIGSAVPG